MAAQLSLPINNDDEDDDLKHHHYLSPYLEHFLPSMGLDRETYAPYVIGLYVVDDNDDNNNNNNDNEEEETEALNEIIDLLQSSSDPPPTTKTNVNENSNDDDDNEEELWNNFRIKIQSLTMDHRLIKSRKREEFLQKEKDRIEDEARTMRMQIDLANEEREKNDGELPKNDDDDDEGADERALRKKALIERFMYDESVEYDANGDPINELSPSSSSDAAAGGKMKVGATTAAARVAEQRGGAVVSSKKEEQQKTKLAKKDKERKKEERRGRARRGERKS